MLDVEQPLSIQDLQLCVNPQKGRIVEQDMTCNSNSNSNSMMEHIRGTGAKLRNEVYSFISADTLVYLFMDNARGHGKTAIKQEMREF